MSIVTRHGDAGETGLLYGGRVPKDDLHTEAYGALDEAISALGLARAMCAAPARAERILELQRDLFTVGAELATAASDHDKLEKHFATVTTSMVESLDAEVAALEARVPLPKGFVIPGSDPVAAGIDLGRTFVRRAERRAVSLQRAGELANPQVLRYLNRCSDLLFMMAREAEGSALVAK
ncbi:MAG: cob(I)yrinic acid a,c-diamide adenosyltransferase [Candidatus Dormibacteria bacterium]